MVIDVTCLLRSPVLVNGGAEVTEQKEDRGKEDRG